MARKPQISGKKQIRPRKKNVSIGKIAEKVINAVKNTLSGGKTKKKVPFGGKGGRKKKPTEKELKLRETEQRIKDIENGLDEELAQDSGESTNGISSVFGSFFYTDEKFINQFEDKEILAFINVKYPMLDPRKYDESKLRKQILYMLNDSKFICGLLDKYSMDIFDFFKFLYRLDSSVFSGMFI